MRTSKHGHLAPGHFDINQRMIHLLMLRSDFLKNQGLLSGKMGLVLFFACYHKISSVDVYESVADELMDQVLEEINKELPIGLETGLAGIGWGIEFLLQHGLMEGEGDDICEEIDAKIMEKDPRRIMDFSLETGMEGLFHYVLAHIRGALKTNGRLPFDPAYLADLHVAAIRLAGNEDAGEGAVRLAHEYIGFYEGTKELDYELEVVPFIGEIKIDEKRLTANALGLKDGIAGFLFQTLIYSQKTYEKNLLD